VTEKWIPEINSYVPKAKFIFIGNKLDIWEDGEAMKKLQEEDDFYQEEMKSKIIELKKKHPYIETSCLTKVNVEDAVKEAICVENHEHKKNASSIQFFFLVPIQFFFNFKLEFVCPIRMNYLMNQTNSGWKLKDSEVSVVENLEIQNLDKASFFSFLEFKNLKKLTIQNISDKSVDFQQYNSFFMENIDRNENLNFISCLICSI
jgi:hypothetical protein